MKQQLMQSIGRAELGPVFFVLEKKADVSYLKQRHIKREEFEAKLAREKRQYTSEELARTNEEEQKDFAEITKLVELFF